MFCNEDTQDNIKYKNIKLNKQLKHIFQFQIDGQVRLFFVEERVSKKSLFQLQYVCLYFSTINAPYISAFPYPVVNYTRT